MTLLWQLLMCWLRLLYYPIVSCLLLSFLLLSWVGVRLGRSLFLALHRAPKNSTQYAEIKTIISLVFSWFIFLVAWLPGFYTLVLVSYVLILVALSLVLHKMISWLFLFERPIKRGDWIRVGDIEGTVTELSLFFAHVRTPDGMTFYLSNNKLSSNRVINYSAPLPQLRLSISVEVGHDASPAQVEAILFKLATQEQKALHDPPPEVLLRNLGESGLEYMLIIWIEDPKEQFSTASRLGAAIEKALHEAKLQYTLLYQVD
jgi:small-conductance mechanosensitive channel